MKQLPTKKQVLRLMESRSSPGARLAVALAAYGGLHPRQVKGLVFGKLVEFSLAKRMFSEVPSRIRIAERVGYRVTVVMFYTFLSTSGCRWLLEDLKTHTRRLTTESPVVTSSALRESEKAIHAEGLRWHDLRDYFCASCLKVGTPHYAVDFMLGHKLKGSDRFRNLSGEAEFLRKQYAKVEERFFI